MASTVNDCNAFLKEYKRVLKSLRVGHRPSVPAFPADPRSLPPGLLEQAYDGQAAQVLLPSVLPGHEPGKWMRGTSKELTICKKKASSKKHDDFYAMMQSMHGMQANTKNWQRMQQFMSMMNKDDMDEPLSNLVLFPNKKIKGFGRCSHSCFITKGITWWIYQCVSCCRCWAGHCARPAGPGGPQRSSNT